MNRAWALLDIAGTAPEIEVAELVNHPALKDAFDDLGPVTFMAEAALAKTEANDILNK